MSEPDFIAKTIVTALAILVLAALVSVPIGVWIKDIWTAAHWNPAALGAQNNDIAEDNELHAHLLDLGFTPEQLNADHMVVGHRVVYTVPHELLVAQITDASDLHRRTLQALAGHR